MLNPQHLVLLDKDLCVTVHGASCVLIWCASMIQVYYLSNIIFLDHLTLYFGFVHIIYMQMRPDSSSRKLGFDLIKLCIPKYKEKFWYR